MCFFKTYQCVQSGEGAAEGGLLLNDTSTRKRVFCLCSKRTGCLYCYVLRHAGCGGRPGTLAPPLEGTVRQEADGICSYQPPSGAPKTSVYYTPKCQHTRLPTKPAMKTPWVAMGGCHVLPDKICGWQAPRHPSLPKQPNQRDGPRTGRCPSQQPLQKELRAFHVCDAVLAHPTRTYSPPLL